MSHGALTAQLFLYLHALSEPWTREQHAEVAGKNNLAFCSRAPHHQTICQ
jgi:hypothetical protein